MRPSKMRQLRPYALGLILAMCMAPSRASVVQSLTIEEIGGASGGLGTSANFALGGEYSIGGYSRGPFGFVSAGSADGKILMGRRQGPGAFTPGFGIFDDAGPAYLLFPNTLDYAPTGWVFEAGPPLMALQLRGLGIVFLGTNYPMPEWSIFAPLLQIDETHYYYSVDWTYTPVAWSPVAGGILASWHLEGIATVPEPGTIWLVGGTLLGLLGVQYRKRA
jgi:PEP-CTERM motif